MSTREVHEAAEHFPNDVREHVLTVLQDEGLYRHLRFAKPGTYNQSFSIVTWPGSLCFTGDMGTYVFQRIEDMLAFFRHEHPNYCYWAEKCVAQDRCGVRVYSADLFESRARELLAEGLEDVDEARRESVREAFEENVVRRSEAEHEARAALAEFDEHGVTFSDTWELNFETYTYRYVWCCHALVWAIKQYDASRARVVGATA